MNSVVDRAVQRWQWPSGAPRKPSTKDPKHTKHSPGEVTTQSAGRVGIRQVAFGLSGKTVSHM
ncbi:hypothetical protein TRAPUB_8742 [Trametes pubescens]|uniref:Uncharacterized protein n=1 Tax=Trametes pubescens TaxID=154538 RepID=A0A1M2W4B7_TRAPU|nr:hypothetical protein TRAPUB_8742 [Trametes pubescens]